MKRTRRKSGGFTLIELVAAFAIFAIGIAIALQIASSAIGMARRSATYTHAALLAQSKLDELGWAEALEEGGDSGEFDPQYSWEMNVTRLEPPVAEGGPTEEIPVELYKVELIVRWREGRAERDAKFVTMRAVQPSSQA